METSFNAIKTSFEKSINVVQYRYKSPIFQFLRDESAMLLMLKRFREIVSPSTTSMIEPEVQTKTRGRPKVKKTRVDISTKREKSAFEYADSFNDSCSQVPDSLECGYVLRTEDVNANGYCGFHAIAGLVLGDQESWSRVRTNLFHEIHSNSELWDKYFLKCGRREKVENILNCHELIAPTRYWFVLPDLGHIVATV
ncbi:hypothetical protein C2S51_020869 [Perilla frutescens var. frutescens]|nr:hypothetical protein C2S51_020869 [Perilla frutescens var. frutescens]